CWALAVMPGRPRLGPRRGPPALAICAPAARAARLGVAVAPPSEPPGVLDLDRRLSGDELPGVAEAELLVARGMLGRPRSGLVVVVDDEEIPVGLERPADPVVRAQLAALGIVLGEAAELDVRGEVQLHPHPQQVLREGLGEPLDRLVL